MLFKFYVHIENDVWGCTNLKQSKRTQQLLYTYIYKYIYAARHTHIVVGSLLLYVCVCMLYVLMCAVGGEDYIL